jgi:hypothetical protein
MANLTNEKFMEDLAKSYPPDFDWNAVPDPETLPPIYMVEGERWSDTSTFFKHETQEAAEAHAQNVREKWSGVKYGSVKVTKGREEWYPENVEKWSVDYQTREHFSISNEYATLAEAEAQIERMKTWGNVIQDSVKIVEKSPSAAVDLWLLKIFREEILSGKKVFPMYLP